MHICCVWYLKKIDFFFRCWVVNEQEAEVDGGHDLWSATRDPPVHPTEGVWPQDRTVPVQGMQGSGRPPDQNQPREEIRVCWSELWDQIQIGKDFLPANCFADYCRVFSFWFLEDVGFEFFVYCGYILFFGFNVPLNKDKALSVSVESIIQSQKLLINLKFDCLTCIWILCAENGGR